MKKSISLLIFFTSINFVWAQGLDWVRFFSGPSIERIVDMTIDKDDNIIILGFYDQTIDLDPGLDTLFPTTSDSSNIFVEKISSTGNLIWAKTFGSTVSETPGNIAVDSDGNILISGDFVDSIDVDPGIGVLNIFNVGLGGFILKLDSSGNFKNVYQDYFTINPFRKMIKVESNRNLLYCSGPNLFELDTSLQLIRTQFIGNSAIISHIEIDDNKNIILAGSYFTPTDFDPGIDTFLLTPPGNNWAAFFALYDSSRTFIWAQSIGNTQPNIHITDMVPDHSGNIYATLFANGSLTLSNNLNDTNLTSVNSGQLVYNIKFDSLGNLVWSEALENLSCSVTSNSMAIDQNNTQYFSGNSNCIALDFDPSTDTLMISTSDFPTFIQILDSTNNYLSYSEYSGTSLIGISRLIVNSNNDLYAVGYYHGFCYFDSTANISSTSQNFDDGFLSKYNSHILNQLFENIQTEKLSIFPNPGRESVSIKLNKLPSGKAVIRVMNYLGNIIWDSTVESSELKNGYRFSVAGLSNGIYTIIVSAENKIFSERYIKLD